jgi:molybdopterin synthase catalytic subunit
MAVIVQAAPFEAAMLLAAGRGMPGVGAVVTFTGQVRDTAGDLDRMEIEHYPGMTERAIGAMLAEATARWALLDGVVIHRHGTLLPGEAIMGVATAAAHRPEAFAAAGFLMDYLKSRAPFWKKEVRAGRTSWVASRDDDETALRRW